MEPIIIQFTPSELGRVEFDAEVQTADLLSLRKIRFKLDSGSDLTTLSHRDLNLLGYTEEFLRGRPAGGKASTAAGEVLLRYIDRISIKFQDRELQGCRLYFTLGADMRSLFGNDILKYFNREINYDKGELVLNETQKSPLISESDNAIQIYSLDNSPPAVDLSGESRLFT